jgi:hypothetical protein
LSRRSGAKTDMSEAIRLYDIEGQRLYLISAERDAFLDTATQADRPVRTLCAGCTIPHPSLRRD